METCLLLCDGDQASHGVARGTLGRWRQKDQEFKVILGYLVSVRPAWATG